MKCEPWEIAGVERHGVGQMGARHEMGDQRHARRIEHDVERRGQRRADVDMPDLDQAGEGQDAERDRDQKIAEGRDQKEFLAIEKIRQGAAE